MENDASRAIIVPHGTCGNAPINMVVFAPDLSGDRFSVDRWDFDDLVAPRLGDMNEKCQKLGVYGQCGTNGLANSGYGLVFQRCIEITEAYDYQAKVVENLVA